MTTEEIFSKLAAHMIKGIMIHNEIAQQFNFLGLEGYALCHYNHHVEETHNYMRLCDYYSTHYHKLIEILEVSDPQLIPQSWYKYTTIDVDNKTRREAIQSIMNQWIDWEKDTKKLYQTMYEELCILHESASAFEVAELIHDVTTELAGAEKNLIQLEMINYDWVKIIEEDQVKQKKYKKKLGW